MAKNSLIFDRNLYAIEICDNIKKYAIFRRSCPMVFLEVLFEESILRNDNLIDFFIRKYIIECIEVFSENTPLQMKIAGNLIIDIFKWGNSFSWKSNSFHKIMGWLPRTNNSSMLRENDTTNKFAFCKNNIYYQSSKYTWNVGVPTAILVRKPKKNDWTKFIFSRFL